MSEITAVIITYNEQDYIGPCITSLQGIAEEIIVVDSFSDDRTEEVCSKYNVKFVKHEFEGYVEQKNWALKLAKNNLVVSLDADEALSPQLRESILKVKENPEFDGYYFDRRNNYCGKWLGHSEWYPNRQLRMFHQGKGKWVGLNPHDKFKMINGSRTVRLKGDLLHWNFETFDEHVEKMKNFSSIAAEEYLRAGKRSGPFTPFFHMAWSFLRSYILTAGFLDGYPGYKISAINAYGCYLKYIKLQNLLKKKKSIQIIDDIRGGSEEFAQGNQRR
jgi:glycosyltransferase involved in cell wall biosynthesis